MQAFGYSEMEKCWIFVFEEVIKSHLKSTKTTHLLLLSSSSSCCFFLGATKGIYGRSEEAKDDEEDEGKLSAERH